MNAMYSDNGISGWMGADELIWLYEIARGMESIVEIGSWFGRSTHALLSGCSGTVYAIDTFKGSPYQIDGPHSFAKTGDVKAEFLKNVSNFKNLVTIEKESHVASIDFSDNSIDMIFIDGDHRYEFVKQDFDVWMPKCNKLFCGHDMNEEGVPQALKELGIPIINPVGCIWYLDYDFNYHTKGLTQWQM